jgi:hypothetical protein
VQVLSAAREANILAHVQRDRQRTWLQHFGNVSAAPEPHLAVRRV